MSWLDLSALFASCGISRQEFMSYSIPYINAVTPKIIERLLMSNPFCGVASKTDNAPQNVYGSNGKLTANQVMDVFSGLI